MSRNFNVPPYFDDFSDSANFHRILFKPGYSVQARELTQAQTILQDQITKFGNFIFKDGSKVTGGEITISKDIVSLRLVPFDDFDTIIDYYTGYFVVGDSSGCLGQIISYTTVSDPNSPTGSLPVLYIKLIRGINFFADETVYVYNNQFDAVGSFSTTRPVVTEFTAFKDTTLIKQCYGKKLSDIITTTTDFNDIRVGDYVSISGDKIDKYASVLEVIDSKTIRLSSVLLLQVGNINNQSINGESISFIRKSSRKLLEVSVSDGVFYSNGIFIKFNGSSIVPSVYTDMPTLSVGLYVVETIVDIYDDDSLLDPALGSYNYSAPGADRYKISFNLITKSLASIGLEADLFTSSKYIELVRLSDGNIATIRDKSTLGEINKTLNRRTYDQSGNFSVIQNKLLFPIESQETSDTINAKITPGKSYILGEELENKYPISISIKKGRDTEQSPLITKHFGYSYDDKNNVKDNYFIIDSDSYSGDPSFIFPNINILDYKLDLLKPNTANPTQDIVIGNCKIRNIVRESGTDIYVYYYDPVIIDVSSTIRNTTKIKGEGDTFSANVVETSFNNQTFNSLILDLGIKYIKPTLSSNLTFNSQKYKSNIVIENNLGTWSTTQDIYFNDDTKILIPESILIVRGYSGSDPNGHYSVGKIIPTLNYTIEYTNTPLTTVKIKMNDNEIDSTLYVDVVLKTTIKEQKPKTKTVSRSIEVLQFKNTTSLNLTNSDIKSIKYASRIPVNSQTTSENGEYYSVTTWNTNSTYAVGSVVYVTSKEKLYTCVKPIISQGNPDPSVSTGYWELLPDEKGSLILDNGQTDFHYGLGSISLLNGKNSAMYQGKVAIIYDYYSWDNSTQSSYFSCDSYVGIPYSEVPTYTSKKTGKTYRLNDCLDFRPKVISSDSTTPGEYLKFEPYVSPLPSSYVESTEKYEYYLPRIDKLVLSNTGKFKIIKGLPSLTPIEPRDDYNFMSIARLSIPAYTFKDADIQIKYTDNLRYTMDDIRKLDNRISSLEYYTSLSQLEQDAYSRVVENTNNAPKSGILVDSFIGHSNSNYNSKDHTISIHAAENSIKPPFYKKILKLEHNIETQESDVISLDSNRKYLTVPFTEELYVSSDIPSIFGSVKINPFNSLDYRGSLVLSPDMDILTDAQSPVVVLDDENDDLWVRAVDQINKDPLNNKNSVNLSETNKSTGFYTNSLGITTQLGTVWQDWKEVGDPYKRQAEGSDTIKTLKDYTREGITKTLKSATLKVSNAVAYCRQIPIQFNAFGLKPLTEVFLFCNNKLIPDVTPHTNPIGEITFINVINRGSDYTDPTISINGANSHPAQAIAVLTPQGKIDHILIVDPGMGYDSTCSVVITDTTGTGATAVASIVPKRNGSLITDEYGSIVGEFIIPEKTLCGKLKIDICENPISPAIAGSYATASFIAEQSKDYGTIYKLETIITSPNKDDKKTEIIGIETVTPITPVDPPPDSTPVVITTEYHLKVVSPKQVYSKVADRVVLSLVDQNGNPLPLDSANANSIITNSKFTGSQVVKLSSMSQFDSSLNSVSIPFRSNTKIGSITFTANLNNATVSTNINVLPPQTQTVTTETEVESTLLLRPIQLQYMKSDVTNIFYSGSVSLSNVVGIPKLKSYSINVNNLTLNLKKDFNNGKTLVVTSSGFSASKTNYNTYVGTNPEVKFTYKKKTTTTKDVTPSVNPQETSFQVSAIPSSKIETIVSVDQKSSFQNEVSTSESMTGAATHASDIVNASDITHVGQQLASTHSTTTSSPNVKSNITTGNYVELASVGNNPTDISLSSQNLVGDGIPKQGEIVAVGLEKAAYVGVSVNSYPPGARTENQKIMYDNIKIVGSPALATFWVNAMRKSKKLGPDNKIKKS